MVSDKAKLIDIVRFSDPRGNLSVLEHPGALPFTPERAYWIYDVPAGNYRDGHAYRSATELIVALSGSFDITVEHGGETRRFTLSRPDTALLVGPMTWRRIDNFATNSVALVVTDTLYDEADYIRDKELFDSLTIPTADERDD